MPDDSLTILPEATVREGLVLSEKATPGPWFIAVVGSGDTCVVASCRHGGYADSHHMTDEDWAAGHIWKNKEDFDCVANMEFCVMARAIMASLANEVLARRKAMEDAPCSPECASRRNSKQCRECQEEESRGISEGFCSKCPKADCDCWKAKWSAEREGE